MSVQEFQSGLSSRVRDGRVHIAVYGAGRVGATVTAAWLRAGAKVILADIDRKRIESIMAGSPLFSDEPQIDETLREGFKARRFVATTHPAQAAAMADVNVVAVPVGLKGGQADLSSVRSVFGEISARIRKGSLSILETSVPPGTCREVVLPILQRGSGLKADEDFGFAYSPERIFEGRALADLEENYAKIVAGVGPSSLRAASSLYSCIAKKGTIELSSLETAEAEKLFEGVYRDVNIALANELGVLSEKLGVDYWEAMRAANSQPFSHLHRPGPGVGGACIPVYPVFVSASAKSRHAKTQLAKAARRINRSMPSLVAREAISYLKGRQRHVAVLGLAFRGDIADDRMSPTYDLLKELKRLRCVVKVHDPLVRRDMAGGYPVFADLAAALKGCQLVLLATDHRAYRDLDYKIISTASGSEPLVYDSRGILDRSKFPPGKLLVLGRPQ